MQKTRETRRRASDLSPRVALLFDGFDQGGIGRVNLLLANDLLDRGYDVDLIVHSARGPRVGEAPAGATIYDLKNSRKARLILALVKYFRAHTVEAVYVANALLAAHVAIAARLACSRAVIVGVHHVDIARSVDSLPRFSIRYLQTRHVYRILKRLLGFHAATVSEGAKRSLISATGLPPEAVQVLYNPVRLNDPGEPVPEDLLSWWNSGGALKLLTVGRITPEKDLLTLFDALSLVLQTRPARLLIVGFGPYESELRARLADRGLQGHVRFSGFVAQPKKYYEAADVFVSSSLTEALPLTLIEALSAGLPVVATDCPYGPSEILGQGKWGTLVPMRNSASMAAAILAASSQSITQHERRERASFFSVERASENYLAYTR